MAKALPDLAAVTVPLDDLRTLTDFAAAALSDRPDEQYVEARDALALLQREIALADAAGANNGE